MKIIYISGGLGNQMFQYAFLVAMREATGDVVLMDASKYETYKLHNGFELDTVFKVSARCATKEEIKAVSRYTTNYKLSRVFRKFLPKRKTEVVEPMPTCPYNPNIFAESVGDMYYEGIWQNCKYFDRYRSEILKEFEYKSPLSGKNVEYAELFAKGTTVSMHIRRGDYLKHKNYIGLCGVDYYEKAIEYVKGKYGRNIRFAIFSNDMQWCEDNILPMIEGYECVMVDWNKGKDSYNDMRLMSCCKVNIIANSSFSWWAAYLNETEGKEIIAPAKWSNMPVQFDRQLPEWTMF